MPVIPAFELGLWNAWILVLPMLIIFFYTMRVTSVRELGEEGDFELTKKEKRIINAVFLPMIISSFMLLSCLFNWVQHGYTLV